MSSSTERTVPFGFFGAHTDRYCTASVATLEQELALMVDSGVETLRVTFLWGHIQMFYAPRFPGAMHAVGEWIRPDAIVGAAARAGLKILGTVWGAPSWAVGGLRPGDPQRFAYTALGGVPAHSSDFANFMTDLVERYGPDGTFWRDNPDIPKNPVRQWQPWQEPDRPAFNPQPFDRAYFVEMAHAAYAAVKAADPEAIVYGTGFGPDCKEPDLLESVYAAGYAGAADILSFHPFPGDAAGLVDVLKVNREVMARYGEGEKPMVLSQMSFSSALGQTRHPQIPNMKDEEGQAAAIREALSTLAERREELGLHGIYYHGWSGCDTEAAAPNPGDPWLFTGLRRVEPDGTMTSKPALAAYREVALALEGRA
ncbi:hypothetical protein GCM10028801_08120 [Nocardioides maradonensis]